MAGDPARLRAGHHRRRDLELALGVGITDDEWSALMDGAA